MPLSLTVSCSSKIQIGFTFLVPAYPGYPGKEAVKWLLLLLLLSIQSCSCGGDRVTACFTLVPRLANGVFIHRTPADRTERSTNRTNERKKNYYTSSEPAHWLRCRYLRARWQRVFFSAGRRTRERGRFTEGFGPRGREKFDALVIYSDAFFTA